MEWETNDKSQLKMKMSSTHDTARRSSQSTQPLHVFMSTTGCAVHMNLLGTSPATDLGTLQLVLVEMACSRNFSCHHSWHRLNRDGSCFGSSEAFQFSGGSTRTSPNPNKTGMVVRKMGRVIHRQCVVRVV